MGGVKINFRLGENKNETFEINIIFSWNACISCTHFKANLCGNMESRQY